jgi:hypothetical protein
MPAAVEDYAAIAKRLRVLTGRGSAIADPANSTDQPVSSGPAGNILRGAARRESTDEWRYYFWIPPLPSHRSTA